MLLLDPADVPLHCAKLCKYPLPLLGPRGLRLVNPSAPPLLVSASPTRHVFFLRGQHTSPWHSMHASKLNKGADCAGCVRYMGLDAAADLLFIVFGVSFFLTR